MLLQSVRFLVADTDDHADRDDDNTENLFPCNGLMEDQGSPHKNQDIAEPASQVGGCQRKLLQDQLPADGIKAENHDSQTEPGDVAGREKRVFAAELQAGRRQALHEDGDDRQKYNIASFT